MKNTLIICLVILILINVPPISWFCKIITEDYTYSSYNGVIQYQENLMKGTSFNTYAESFDERVKSDPNIKDKQLYRTFTLQPWRFWEWHEWVVHYKRFTLPYISEEQVLKNRKKEGLPEKY